MIPSIRISIAMCTFNGVSFLAAQLNSMLAQTRMPDELLISDDGSTDGTLQVLHHFAKTASFPVRILENSKRLGSTSNFAQAIGHCEGDIIVLADQDDVWQPKKLQCIELAFSAVSSLDGIFSDGILIDEQGRSIKGTLWQRVGFGARKQAAVLATRGFDVLLQGNFVTGATLAFRAPCKDYLLPIPAGWVHDYWIALLLAANSQLHFIDAALIKYRCHENQQLGVGLNVAEKWRRVFIADHAAYLAAEMRWNQVCERLYVSGVDAKAPALIQCKAIAAHMHLRGTLPSSRLHRLRTIFMEIFNGNYSRYSLGVISIMRDIVSR